MLLSALGRSKPGARPVPDRCHTPMSQNLSKHRHVVRVKTSVDIEGVTPDIVFDLITDLPRKTRLCRNTAVINISRHPAGPVAVGTVFHHRVAVDGHIADYHNSVVAFEHNKYMITESDSSPPFRIEVSVEAIESGTRLTQEESFAFTELVLPVPTASGWLGKMLRFVFGDDKVIRQGDHALQRDVRETQQRLQPRLNDWLENIKRHLETENRHIQA